MAKQWTPEERKAFADKMKAARAAKAPAAIEPSTTEVVGAPADTIVGAKLSIDDSEIKSMLEGINEDSEVDIYNPLDQGFRVQFAVDSYQRIRLTPQEQDVRDKAGLPYEKDSGQAQQRIVKFTVLPSHRVTPLPGKVAHVAIKQLRNYLIGIEGNKAKLADPVTQRQYEERIIMKIRNRMDEPETQMTEADRRIEALSEAFPGVSHQN